MDRVRPQAAYGLVPGWSPSSTVTMLRFAASTASFWQPVMLSSEVQDAPKRIRALGEDFVLFRGRDGRVGCLDLHCSHRGASLEYGLITERGFHYVFQTSATAASSGADLNGMAALNAAETIKAEGWAWVQTALEADGSLPVLCQ